jgi:hypothetical protein
MSPTPPLRPRATPSPRAATSSTDSSAPSASDAPELDPLDDLGETLDEFGTSADAFGRTDPGAPAAAAPVPVEGLKVAVAMAFRLVEAWAVRRYGEPMRATEAERGQIVDAGTHAAALYGPLFLSHPLTPLAFALGGWIVRGTMAARAASSDGTTQGPRPDTAGEPRPAPDFGAPQPDNPGAGFEGLGENALDEGAG